MENKLAVLLTYFNNKDKTLSCLQSLLEAKLLLGFTIDTFLVDEDSKVGKSKTMVFSLPNVKIINGSCDLYWAIGIPHLHFMLMSQVLSAINFGLNELQSKSQYFLGTVRWPKLIINKIMKQSKT